MHGLEESIVRMAQCLMTLPCDKLQCMESTTRQLTSEQVGFIRNTLELARLDDRSSAPHIGLVEYFFESWRKHSLATRLVIIDRVVELSNGGDWPGGIPLRIAADDSCDVRRFAVAETPQARECVDVDSV